MVKEINNIEDAEKVLSDNNIVIIVMIYMIAILLPLFFLFKDIKYLCFH